MKLLLLSALFPVLFITGGCVTPPPDTPPSQTSSTADFENVYMDSAVRNRLTVEDVRTSFVEGDMIVAQAAVEVTGTREFQLLYQWEWFDEYGQALPAITSSYRRAFARPGKVLSLRGVAPSPKARDFRLNLKAR